MSDDNTPEAAEVAETPVVNEAIQTPDASESQEALEANIDKELGLEPAKKEETSEAAEEVAETSEETPADDQETDDAVDEETEDTEEATQGVDPNALALEVQDAEGKTYKITKVEDLPEDFVPKNNRQVIEIIRDLTRLESQTEKQELDRQNSEQAAQLQAAQDAQIKSWDSEIADLQKSGRLEKPKLQPDVDGFLDDPAVKKTEAVFKLMAELNNKRSAAGNQNRITSFEDALDKYELQETRTAAAETEKSEGQTAKEKAAVIGRTSSPATSNEGVYVAGSARSIYDLD